MENVVTCLETIIRTKCEHFVTCTRFQPLRQPCFSERGYLIVTTFIARWIVYMEFTTVVSAVPTYWMRDIWFSPCRLRMLYLYQSFPALHLWLRWYSYPSSSWTLDQHSSHLCNGRDRILITTLIQYNLSQKWTSKWLESTQSKCRA